MDLPFVVMDDKKYNVNNVMGRRYACMESENHNVNNAADHHYVNPLGAKLVV